MGTNVNSKIKQLSPGLRTKIETKAARLVAEEMALRGLLCPIDQEIGVVRRARSNSQTKLPSQ